MLLRLLQMLLADHPTRIHDLFFNGSPALFSQLIDRYVSSQRFDHMLQSFHSLVLGAHTYVLLYEHGPTAGN